MFGHDSSAPGRPSARPFLLLPFLLFAAVACNEIPETDPVGISASQQVPFATAVEDVPSLVVDLPRQTRAIDTSETALAEAVRKAEGRVIVGFKNPSNRRFLNAAGEQTTRPAVSAGAIQAGLSVVSRHTDQFDDYIASIGAVLVTLSPDVATQLAGNPYVDYIEPRRSIPYFGAGARAAARAIAASQTTPWGISTIRADQAQWYETGSFSSVMIIDSGHEQGHPDLPSVPSSNCDGNQGGCTDGTGHGTGVLGVLMARDNSTGTLGVATGVSGSNTYVWGACTNTCDQGEVLNGIQEAETLGVDVLNMSLGDSVYSASTASAVSSANSAGVVQVAGAGNHCHGDTVFACSYYDNYAAYPAAYTDVIGVSGINSDKTLSHPAPDVCDEEGINGGTATLNSNWGTHVDLTAPFYWYTTDTGSGYKTRCGTSFSSPAVAGVAALVRSLKPALTPLKVRQRLHDTAEDLGSGGYDSYYGYGLVDAYDAVGPHASIVGPSDAPEFSSCEWTASVQGGYGSYSYEWYRDGSLVDNDDTYFGSTGYSDFELRLQVTDGQNVIDEDILNVTVSAEGDGSCEA